MDNVTHTLIGIAAGEAVSAYRKKARVPLWIASAIANNLPDSDVLLTSTIFNDKLGYLLHHRGHTHTFVATPLLALALLLPLFWLWKKKQEIPWREIVFLCLLGTPLHLLADFWNSYGVHPFWPFSSEWIYGDMIFIVEPWIWAMLLPPIFLACSTKVGKGICLALMGSILGLAWYHAFVPWPAAAALTLGSGILFWAQRKISDRRNRIVVGISCLAAFLFGLGSINRSLTARLSAPGEELLLQPYPANPFCWISMAAKLDSTSYSARISLVAPFPKLVSVDHCPDPLSGGTSAPLQKSPELADASRRDLGTFRSTRDEFDSISADCRMNALLRFARIPYWVKKEDGWIVGDLRFDRDSSLSFGEFFLPDEGKICPQFLPPWLGRFHPERL